MGIEKSQKFNMCNLEIVSFILGVIGKIWSAFIAVTCAISIYYVSEIQRVIEYAKQYYMEHFAQGKSTSDDIWCIQLDFVSNWLEWIILSLSLISICKFMANGALMYGIKQRKPSFIKCWLIINLIESILMVSALIFELTALSAQIGFFTIPVILYSVQFSLWLMVFYVYENLKKEARKEGLGISIMPKYALWLILEFSCPELRYVIIKLKRLM